MCGAAQDIIVARAALHFWEEPPISGESGSGTVFFAHCPLRCVYCQNADLAEGRAGESIDIERLSGICLELQDQGALNVNFVTPTHYSLLIRDAVNLARKKGLSLPIVWNTSGYEREEVVQHLSETVDIWLVDYKYADPALAERYSRASNYPKVALNAIEAMAQISGAPSYDVFQGQKRMTRGVIVRHLILPHALEQSKQALRLLFEKLGNSVAYSIMNQYTPVMPDSALVRYPELGRRVDDREYEELLDFADELGIEDYFWQQGPAAEESFIPAWDGSGVCKR